MGMIFELYKVRTNISLRHQQNVQLSKMNHISNSQKFNPKAMKFLKKRTNMSQKGNILLIFITVLY